MVIKATVAAAIGVPGAGTDAGARCAAGQHPFGIKDQLIKKAHFVAAAEVERDPWPPCAVLLLHHVDAP